MRRGERALHPLAQRCRLLDRSGSAPNRRARRWKYLLLFGAVQDALAAMTIREGSTADCLGERVANEGVGQCGGGSGSQRANQAGLGLIRDGLAAKYDQRWPRIFHWIT